MNTSTCCVSEGALHVVLTTDNFFRAGSQAKCPSVRLTKVKNSVTAEIGPNFLLTSQWGQIAKWWIPNLPLAAHWSSSPLDPWSHAKCCATAVMSPGSCCTLKTAAAALPLFMACDLVCSTRGFIWSPECSGARHASWRQRKCLRAQAPSVSIEAWKRKPHDFYIITIFWRVCAIFEIKQSKTLF